MGCSTPTSCQWSMPNTLPNNTEGNVESPLGSSKNCFHAETRGTRASSHPFDTDRFSWQTDSVRDNMPKRRCKHHPLLDLFHLWRHTQFLITRGPLVARSSCQNDNKNRVHSSVHARRQLNVITEIYSTYGGDTFSSSPGDSGGEKLLSTTVSYKDRIF